MVYIYIDDTPSPSSGGVTIPAWYYSYMHSNIGDAIGRWNTYFNIWNMNIDFVYADNASSANVIIKYG